MNTKFLILSALIILSFIPQVFSSCAVNEDWSDAPYQDELKDNWFLTSSQMYEQKTDACVNLH
jgi:hypothetical protein